MDTSKNMKIARKMHGLTLIEMMVVITIMAILMGMAIPSFNITIRDNRVLSASNSIVAAVAQARSEAVKRGRMVSLCPSSDKATCGAVWADGWLVYVEDETVVAGAAPVIDTILVTGDAMNKLAVTRTAGVNDWIRFSTRGLAEESITLEVKPDTCGTGYGFQELVIGVTGRATMTKKTC